MIPLHSILLPRLCAKFNHDLGKAATRVLWGQSGQFEFWLLVFDGKYIPLLAEQGWMLGQSEAAKPLYSVQTGAKRERDSAKP
jgi:hypothetical protein